MSDPRRSHARIAFCAAQRVAASLLESLTFSRQADLLAALFAMAAVGFAISGCGKLLTTEPAADDLGSNVVCRRALSARPARH